MRWLVAALFLLFTTAAHAQLDPACTAGGGTSCPYQWVGVTSVSFTGDGNGQGFVGMTTQCRADFGPGTRMCASEDIVTSDTLNIGAIPAQGCWVRPSWRPTGGSALDESGTEGSGSSMTCGNWMLSQSIYSGLALLPSGSLNNTPNPAGGGLAVSCDVARPVACCKPQPVPTPSSSLSLPIGAGALAGLAMMRGGV